MCVLFLYLFCFQVHKEFILPSEKEGFIHRMGDIIKRAEALMAKEPLVHPNTLRLAQLASHGGVNFLSSSQVSSNSTSLVIHFKSIGAKKTTKTKKFFE